MPTNISCLSSHKKRFTCHSGTGIDEHNSIFNQLYVARIAKRSKTTIQEVWFSRANYTGIVDFFPFTSKVRY